MNEVMKRLMLLALLFIGFQHSMNGQVLEAEINKRLVNSSAFVQFATLYGSNHTSELLQFAKEDREVSLAEFNETEAWWEYTYHTSSYRIVFHTRKTMGGYDYTRIYWK
jgi:hypothetical protein